MTLDEANEVLYQHMNHVKRFAMLSQAWMVARYIHVYDDATLYDDVRFAAAYFVVHEHGYRGDEHEVILAALYEILKDWHGP